MTYEIDETKKRIFNRDSWRCQYNNCTKPATELAHIIAQTKSNAQQLQAIWQSKYYESKSIAWIEKHLINADENMRASCRNHNSYFNRGFDREYVTDYIDFMHKKIGSTW